MKTARRLLALSPNVNILLINLVIVCLSSFTFQKPQLARFAGKQPVVLRVRGKLEGLTDNLIYLKTAPKKVDTVQAQHGFFTFQKTSTEPIYCELTIQGGPGVVPFIWDKDIILMGDARIMERIEVIGSPLTDDYYQYVKQYRDDLQLKYVAYLGQRRLFPNDTTRHSRFSQIIRENFARRKTAALDYIVRGPDSWLSLFLLYQYRNELPKPELQKLYDSLSISLKMYSLANEMNQLLK